MNVFVSGKFCSSVAKYFMVYSSGRMCLVSEHD
jgi:hypothetical protein